MTSRPPRLKKLTPKAMEQYEQAVTKYRGKPSTKWDTLDKHISENKTVGPDIDYLALKTLRSDCQIIPTF